MNHNEQFFFSNDKPLDNANKRVVLECYFMTGNGTSKFNKLDCAMAFECEA